MCSVKRGNKRSKCYFQLVTSVCPKGIISLLIMLTAVPTLMFQSDNSNDLCFEDGLLDLVNGGVLRNWSSFACDLGFTYICSLHSCVLVFSYFYILIK